MNLLNRLGKKFPNRFLRPESLAEDAKREVAKKSELVKSVVVKLPQAIERQPAAREEAAKAVVLAKERSGDLGDIGLAG